METMRAISARKSCRSFLPRQIAKEELDCIVKAGMAAPVGMKKPVHLSVIEDPALLEEINLSAAKTMGNPALKPLYGATAIVIASYPKELGETLGAANTACAVENMLLAATDLGVGNIFLWTANFAFAQNEELAKKCGIPAGYVAVSTAGLGYTDEDVKGETTPKFPVTVNRI